MPSRVAAIVDALPLRAGMRVLEIGCGPGAAARAVAARVGPTGFVLAIDRSAKATALARAGSRAEIAAGVLRVMTVAIEDFELGDEARFDLVFAVRVGVLDGRHDGSEALARIASALRPRGRLFVDGKHRVLLRRRSTFVIS
jgi:cyclopropane fatty-acyl-phospholipid synthase-like methyltransferase